MNAHLAYVGIGTNVGNRAATVARAIDALRGIASEVRASSIYRTLPWGVVDQPEFLNAVVSLETQLPPHELLDALHAIERRLGRIRGERWGPRVIDLDLLLYDDLAIADDRLRLPHEHLTRRAFVLVPLAELDDRFAPMRDALHSSELAGVVRVDGDELARFDDAARESVTIMPAKGLCAIGERVRALASFMSAEGVARLRIVRGDEEIELASRRPYAAAPGRSHDGAVADATPLRVETIKADLVGIFHLSRPAPAEGERFEVDRELGYIEALGIRTPVHSMGAGRLVAIAAADESPVEYGQPLFSIARG